MKRIFFAFIIALMLIASHAEAADDKGKDISIKEYMFAPVALTVPVGSKVTWTNHDDVPHTIVDTGRQFRSSALDTNDSYSYIFLKPGTYHYFCTLHPQMVGTINVTAAP